MKEAVIVSAVRSPMGRAMKGQYVFTRIDDLGAEVIRAALAKIPALDPNLIEDVLIGCAMPEGEQGMNVARNISILAGIPLTAAATTVNRFCGSSLQTIAMAAQAIMTGNGEVFVAAGVETMTHVPMGGFNPSLNKRLMQEGTPKAYISMGMTAENLAKKYHITRAEQDQFALQSHHKALQAQADGLFRAELAEVWAYNAKGESAKVARDEGPRNSTLEQLATLKPVFLENGTVTAGNSSPLTDGAAACVVMSADQASQLGIKGLVRIKAMAVAGCEPEIMGIGPVPAVKKCLARAGMKLSDIDIIELNEAFAAQSLAVIRELEIDQTKLNPKGGAIALGHPLGCSGARIMSTLIQDLITYNKTVGLETMCIGGGQGIATIVERV